MMVYGDGQEAMDIMLQLTCSDAMKTVRSAILSLATSSALWIIARRAVMIIIPYEVEYV